jgi:3-methyladenine DNA glycosylase AlkC
LCNTGADARRPASAAGAQRKHRPRAVDGAMMLAGPPHMRYRRRRTTHRLHPTMAEPLKNHFGTDVPATIAAMVSAVHPRFPAAAFVRDALQGYEALELMPRGRHVAAALHRHLPQDFTRAAAILVASAAQPVARVVGAGMAGFLFMPHLCYIAEHGLAHFEPSMRALHTLTERFTAEFAIRPFLQHHTSRTLQQLEIWTRDPSAQVRRLVSEGTRPRLPWAPRLPAFQHDPRPVLQLLERLKDDPSLYVRRSVANSLNDIGKDHPQLLVETARRWLVAASPEREWIVRHALRWAVKQGDARALDVLGFAGTATVRVDEIRIQPDRAPIGGAVRLAFVVHNTGHTVQDLLIDLKVHYVKANGSTSAKVFKLKSLQLGCRDAARLQKRLTLADLTTRRHFPGVHRVEAMVNGQAIALGSFTISG